MDKLSRFRSYNRLRTRWPLITGAFLMVLAAVFGVYWYRQPYTCNPCATLPKTSTSVLLPDDAVVVFIYVDELRVDLCAVYSTEHGGLGSSWDVQQVVSLARAAARTHSHLPFIIKADVEVPFGLIHETLDAIRAEGVRMVFFQSELDASTPELEYKR